MTPEKIQVYRQEIYRKYQYRRTPTGQSWLHNTCIFRQQYTYLHVFQKLVQCSYLQRIIFPYNATIFGNFFLEHIRVFLRILVFTFFEYVQYPQYILVIQYSYQKYSYYVQGNPEVSRGCTGQGCVHVVHVVHAMQISCRQGRYYGSKWEFEIGTYMTIQEPPFSIVIVCRIVWRNWE
eukprot:TRINITY_DN7681_c2_g1_i1.p3 TRINITY_DN7681_c2_g1~~TRINITY_DN7681_c2_g1_i1.p3  ORF type:complete len:194 (-),score=-19.52 TRINITY_DN7681_c2_g1_i1:33-566(-)